MMILLWPNHIMSCCGECIHIRIQCGNLNTGYAHLWQQSVHYTIIALTVWALKSAFFLWLSLWNGIPHTNQLLLQFIGGVWLSLHGSNMVISDITEIFNWIYIWWDGRARVSWHSLALIRVFLVQMAPWAGILLWIKMIHGPCCWRVGNTDFCNISIYLSAIRFPWIMDQVGVKGFSNITIT